MIKEAEVEMQDAHMTEDDLRKAATDMQTNGIPSEELEDGELEEDKSAQTYYNGESTENFHVRAQRKQLHLAWLMCR